MTQKITTDSPHSALDLQRIYEARFTSNSDYRRNLWAVLSTFFSRWISRKSAVLDLGCGWCEFINALSCGPKFAMDLNPDAKRFAKPGITVIQQDCSVLWPIDSGTLDIVFSSNFFEHLPTKAALERTLIQAYRALRPEGRLIAMGPNIKYLPGAYWDFFDHYLPLTELSLAEILNKCGFEIERTWSRFLPYTMSKGFRYPIWMLRFYLAWPLFWPIFGRQFLLIVRKPASR